MVYLATPVWTTPEPSGATQTVVELPMSRTAARWIAFISAFLSSALALQVALNLGLFAWNGDANGVSNLAVQSREAGVAAVAAIISVIAQLIGKASDSDKR
jgi:hypothetical protein